MSILKSIITKSSTYRSLSGKHDTLLVSYSKLFDKLREAESIHARKAASLESIIGELKDTKSALQAGIKDIRKMYRERIKELEEFRDNILISDMLSVKFTAYIPDAGWRRTEFKLGIGSCGKEVIGLCWKELDDRYVLTQTCSDGERKEFTYFRKDVSGRIELAYKVPNTTHY